MANPQFPIVIRHYPLRRSAHHKILAWYDNEWDTRTESWT